MKSWLIVLLVVGGCTAGDETASGARAVCSEGGVLTQCPDSPQTPEGACFRLVDCGAIPISSTNGNVFDWGQCVDRIEQATGPGQTLIVSCIASSSCDALKVEGSPDDPQRDQISCLHFGGR